MARLAHAFGSRHPKPRLNTANSVSPGRIWTRLTVERVAARPPAVMTRP
ncbi:MAG: hypothetical protein ACRDJO_08505 [Actinomycetota bacterium]